MYENGGNQDYHCYTELYYVAIKESIITIQIAHATVILLYLAWMVTFSISRES